jgi:hypothetical protein
MKPRNWSSRGPQGDPSAGSRGKPTACMRRKAAVLDTRGRVLRTPPGSKSGAGVQRGHSGTWESHGSPCRRDRIRAPVENIPVPRQVTWSWDRAGSEEEGHRQGIGGPGTTEGRREGGVAVVADHSTVEGGEPRPKGPTGGKERLEMTARRGHQGRHFEATNPVTGTLRIADQSVTPIGVALLPGSKTSCPTNRMPSLGTSGSVGGPVGEPPALPGS